MRVARGNSLAMDKPVVRALGLRAGDEIDVRIVGKARSDRPG